MNTYMLSSSHMYSYCTISELYHSTVAYCTCTVSSSTSLQHAAQRTGSDSDREPASGAKGGLERHSAGAVRAAAARLASDHRVRPERQAALPRHAPLRRRRHHHQRCLVRRRFCQYCCWWSCTSSVQLTHTVDCTYCLVYNVNSIYSYEYILYEYECEYMYSIAICYIFNVFKFIIISH